MDIFGPSGDGSASLEFQPLAEDALKPFSPCLTPVYLFMERNQRMIPIKRVLDFFTAEDIRRFGTGRPLHVSAEYQGFTQYSDTGKELRRLLELKPEVQKPSGDAWLGSITPLPSEISRQLSDVTRDLWQVGTNGALCINLLGLVACMEEVCDPLTSESMLKVRENSVIVYDQALLFSNLGIVSALYLGFHNRDYLSALRQQLFNHAGGQSSAPIDLWGEEILSAVKQFKIDENHSISLKTFKRSRGAGRSYQQLVDRVHRQLGVA